MKEVFGVNINWLMTGVHATLLAARTTKQYNNLKSRFDTLKEAIRSSKPPEGHKELRKAWLQAPKAVDL